MSLKKSKYWISDMIFGKVNLFFISCNFKNSRAVFNKQTGNFVTTCQLTPDEAIELKATHNFGGGEGWFSGKVNNLPPKDITPITSFENDVMGITPIDDSQIDNSNT